MQKLPRNEGLWHRKNFLVLHEKDQKNAIQKFTKSGENGFPLNMYIPYTSYTSKL